MYDYIIFVKRDAINLHHIYKTRESFFLIIVVEQKYIVIAKKYKYYRKSKKKIFHLVQTLF